jgi:hypothetical protein
MLVISQFHSKTHGPYNVKLSLNLIGDVCISCTQEAGDTHFN